MISFGFFSKTRVLLAIVLLFSITITFYCQRAGLFNYYAAQDDCQQFTFPFYRINDRELFNEDLFTEYSLRHNTRGVVAIYSYLSNFFDPLIVTKILPFLLCLLTALLAFLIGNRLENRYTAFLSAIMMVLYSWSFIYFSGGHAKAFALPLLLAFIYFSLKDDLYMTSAVLFLQIFIYPPVAALCILAFFLYVAARVIFRSSGGPLINSKLVINISIFILAIVIMRWLYLDPDSFKGNLLTNKECINMEDFYIGGRVAIFFRDPGEMISRLGDQIIAERPIGFPVFSVPACFLFIIFGFGMVLLLKKLIRANLLFICLLVSGFILFISAWFLFPLLYDAGRYLKFSLIPFLVYINAMVLMYCLYLIKKLSIQTRVFICTFILTAAFLPFLNPDLRNFDKTGIYKFIGTLPKDSVIAGHPYEVSEIPLFSKRKVFVEYELSIPLYKDYYFKIAQRTRAFFKIYYAVSQAEFTKDIIDNKLDYLLVKKRDFDVDYLSKGDFYYNPFNNEIRGLVNSVSGRDFIIPKIPLKYRVYEDKDYYIIGLAEWIKGSKGI